MERTIHIWHDKTGRIVAWGHRPEKVPPHVGAIPLAGPNNEVITTQVSMDDLSTLHETHYIDPHSKQLIRK